MLQFKAHDDLNSLSLTHPAYPRIKDLIDRLIINYRPPGRNYNPDDDGWKCLIEEGDVDRVLNEVRDDWKLEDVMWEGITYQDGLSEDDALGICENGISSSGSSDIRFHLSQ